jgi:RNA polymerase sigma factor for flagellar operon FliA
MTMVDQSAPSQQSEQRTARESQLWQDFKTTGSTEARAALFTQYLPLTRRIARQHYHGRGEIEYQDLVQYGCAGLLEAIDRFDAERGVPFPGYARRRIAGSIMDGIAKASEYQQQLSASRRRESERLRSLLPTGGQPPQPIAEAYQLFAELAAGLALGYILEEDTSYAPDETNGGNGYESAAWKQTVEAIKQAVDGLSEREQAIIRSHYEGGLSFDQIGELLGISKGRVSQLHRSALTTLRKRMGQSRPFRFKQ